MIKMNITQKEVKDFNMKKVAGMVIEEWAKWNILTIIIQLVVEISISELQKLSSPIPCLNFNLIALILIISLMARWCQPQVICMDRIE
jgi:hypothetical protein